MLKLYNTLMRKKEVLKLFNRAQGKKLKLFVCGITPYDFAHLGHARTYVFFDAFVKYLRSKGFDVFYLQNVTDLDDKIIKRSEELGKSWKEVSRTFEKEYLKEMRALGVNSVTKYAKATEHMKEIISQVKRLLKKGYAYEIAGDGIYYDVTKFKEYGKLSGRTVQQAEDGISRIDESIQKRNKGDFALWKYSKPGEPRWSFTAVQDGSTVQMNGRPGWHIEDTAITEKYFGPQYDIHGGGRDLMFPHHEAEIAQMEALSNPPAGEAGKKPLARFWMHSGFLTIQGEKMSKSLGNFITIRDFLGTHESRLLRFFILKTHYRSPIDYSEKLLSQTQKELDRIDEFVVKLSEVSKRSSVPHLGTELLSKGFANALEDDFNTPKALAALFDLIRKANPLLEQQKLAKKDTKDVLDFLRSADKIFGFIFAGRKAKDKIPANVMVLAQKREEYRKQKLWSKADQLRQELRVKGWIIEDTSSGLKLKKQS